MQDGGEYLWPVTSDLSFTSCFSNQIETEVKKIIGQDFKISHESSTSTKE